MSVFFKIRVANIMGARNLGLPILNAKLGPQFWVPKLVTKFLKNLVAKYLASQILSFSLSLTHKTLGLIWYGPLMACAKIKHEDIQSKVRLIISEVC